MRNRDKAILCAVLVAWTSLVDAATSITATFIPSPPVYEQPLTVRLADSQGSHCWPAAASVTQGSGVVTLALHFSDSCNPGDILPFRDYLLGSFPVGSYLFVYQSCASNPPPLPSTCNTVLQVPFSVTPPVKDALPVLSVWGTLGLIAGVLLIVGRMRRHRGKSP